MAVPERRQRLEASLSSPALTDKDNVYRMVASQLATSSSGPPLSSSSSSASSTSSASLHTDSVNEGSHFHEIVQSRFVQVWNLLELLRSASGEENHNLAIMAEDDISSEGWKLKHDTGQLRVMYREGPKGTPFHTLLAEGLIDSPITSALCLAWEAPSFNLWWPQMTIPPFKVIECRWVKRGFNGEDLSLIRVKVPWPLAAREVIMCAFELEVFDEELIIVLLHSFPETEDSSCCDKPSEIPDALPNVVRMELAGGFALQKVSSEQSYFRTVVNLDIKLEFVPPWLINFMSRQLVGLGFKLYQKTLESINKGDGSSKHFQKMIETEPMYQRIRNRLLLTKAEGPGEVAALTEEGSHKRPPSSDALKTANSSKSVEEDRNSAAVVVSTSREKARLSTKEIGSSVCEPSNGAGLPSNDASISVDPEVQKALNVLDQMISLVQSRKVGVPSDKAFTASNNGTSHSTPTHPVHTESTDILVGMGKDVELSTVAPLKQVIGRIEEPNSTVGTSQPGTTQTWFCLHSSPFCCGHK